MGCQARLRVNIFDRCFRKAIRLQTRTTRATDLTLAGVVPSCLASRVLEVVIQHRAEAVSGWTQPRATNRFVPIRVAYRCVRLGMRKVRCVIA
jgi:hypothetical protein